MCACACVYVLVCVSVLIYLCYNYAHTLSNTTLYIAKTPDSTKLCKSISYCKSK